MSEAVTDMSTVLNLREFEDHARRVMERPAFDYIGGGAGDERTLEESERAFARYALRPRVLVDVSAVDSSRDLLGGRVSVPLGTAPMAFQHFAHPDAELATARAAARSGALFCLSTMSSRSLEEVAKAADEVGGGPRWFQLYVHRDRGLSAELVQRAEAAGYGALVVTVDLPVAAVRERDVRNRLGYPQVFGNFRPPGREATGGQPVTAVIGGFNDAAFTWADVAWLQGLTRLPLAIKGILTAEDAALAVEHGVAGVVVSNHGGRQLDRTPPAIDVLGEVVQEVAGRAEVFVDGGIRRGVDVLIALALGARGVFIGRPLGYALAVGGESGVMRALELVTTELRTDMALLGVTKVDQLGPQHVRRSGTVGG